MIGMQKMPDTLTQETPSNVVIIEMLLEMEIHEVLEEAVAETEADEGTRMVDTEELVVLGDQKEEKEEEKPVMRILRDTILRILAPSGHRCKKPKETFLSRNYY